MSKLSYAQIREHLDRWIEANRVAGEKGEGWDKMYEFYEPDAIYSWNYGPDKEFVARGHQQLREWAFGTEMAGLDGWRYPYIRTLIDPEKSEVVVFWRQQAPATNPATGKPYEILGTGGSWFRLSENCKWEWQRDWFDLGNAGDCFVKMMENNDLNDKMMQRIERQGGGDNPGWVDIGDFDWLSTVSNPEDM